jgi:desulfoferrodoxin (superoxide reductase-like protein)
LATSADKRFLKVNANPHGRELEHYVTWVSGSFHAEVFDARTLNSIFSETR